VAAGARLAPRARLAYVSPSHQYPLGVTMSVSRRLELLAWAREADAWILEDDYDSEFRYTGRPLACLQGLDHDGRVVYVGTFSKTVFPGLRLGYLIVPPALVAPFAAARRVVDRHPPAVEQAVLADFLTEGHFARHVRRMRGLYEERQAALVEAVGRELAGRVEMRAADAGMHLVGWLGVGVDDQALSARAMHAGIDVPALSHYALTPPARGALLFGYAAFPPARLRSSVRALRDVLRVGERRGAAVW
jgi:GntR family transcriptional regulator / MocR family aminotransferase